MIVANYNVNIGSIIYMGVEKEIKKVELICDTYHVYGIRADIRQNCCGRKMNIHDYRTGNVRSEAGESYIAYTK